MFKNIIRFIAIASITYGVYKAVDKYAIESVKEVLK